MPLLRIVKGKKDGKFEVLCTKMERIRGEWRNEEQGHYRIVTRTWLLTDNLLCGL